jgi:hypothetical protein
MNHPPIHEPPERVSLTCPLGLRFLDVTSDAFVAADAAELRVVASPLDAPLRETIGVVTPRGVFAFHGLPGFRKFENSQANDRWESAPPRRDFQIEVHDGLGRFLPCTFTVSAPERGLALLADAGSPSWIEADAVPLFSAPSRTPPPGLAVVRAELRELASGLPAAWALMEASYSSAGAIRTARGLADDQGRVLLMFPYPEGQRRAFALSPPAGSRGLSQQEWIIDFTVFHEPVEDPEKAAEYGRRLSQPAVLAWGGSSPLAPLGQESLRFGRELELGIIDLVPA